ncbi:hypothetical protein C8J57DRAFT_1726427 [Mycena rebaudengoi]|nr:hypothetical protein C8J57DRAFT_1726427 [Mycena rebaudengoi]
MATPAATTLALANPNLKSPDAKPRKGTIQPCAPHIVKPALAIDSDAARPRIHPPYTASTRSTAAARRCSYATLPAYLRRTPVHLVHALHDAQMHLRARCEARARRVPHARERRVLRISSYEQPGTVDLARGSAARVGARKVDMDAEYDAWAEVLLDTVAADVKAGGALRLGMLRFGTHNWASCEKIFAGVVHPEQIWDEARCALAKTRE